MTLFSLIDTASSSRQSSLKFPRWVGGLGRRNSMGIFCWPRVRVAAASVSAPPSRAARPRPSRGGAPSADLWGLMVAFPALTIFHGANAKTLSRHLQSVHNAMPLVPPLGRAALALDHFRRQF